MCQPTIICVAFVRIFRGKSLWNFRTFTLEIHRHDYEVAKKKWNHSAAIVQAFMKFYSGGILFKSVDNFG